MRDRLLLEEEATGRVKELYEEIRSAFGMVPNFFKAQAAIDPEWAWLNWKKVKHIMLRDTALDRKTKEIIAMVVSLINHCQYCHLAHKTMALQAGATEEELKEAIKVMELFQSFNAIADALQVTCDVPRPPKITGQVDRKIRQ